MVNYVTSTSMVDNGDSRESDEGRLVGQLAASPDPKMYTAFPRCGILISKGKSFTFFSVRGERLTGM